MKLLLLGFLAFVLSLAAQAQPASTDEVTAKPKPLVPILAKDHRGIGRIGVRLAFVKDTGLPQIVGMIRGGPAADYGFQIGDVIVKIDKNFTNSLSQEEIKLALHGEPGSGVELTVQRGDDPRYVVRAIQRRVIPASAEDVLLPMVPENKP